MGKSLIIKGSDFSANGIKPEEVEITSLLTLVKGKSGTNGNTNYKRAGIFPRFDISTYRTDGYTKIKVITKVDGQFVFLCNSAQDNINAESLIDITNNNQGFNVAGTYIAELDNINDYFGANIDIQINNLDDISDYMSVFMVLE